MTNRSNRVVKGAALRLYLDRHPRAAQGAVERVTKHDVIAFLTHLAEVVGPEARFVHQGMTSSDVLDTCLAVQLTQATDLLLSDLVHAVNAVEKE